MMHVGKNDEQTLTIQRSFVENLVLPVVMGP